jgi:AbrB family looped-hinge helix DNA binding protein
MTARATTRVSTKGQIVLPKALRERQGWRAGLELTIEERPDGLLLRPAQAEAPTRYEDVAGCLGPAKRTVSVEEMNSAIGNYVRKRWGREYDDLD